MSDWLFRMFDPTGFPARWHCGEWSPFLGWLHILSDLTIWLAYMGIPAVLLYFVRKRTDVPLLPVFILFILFIASCGFGHLVEATMFWWPAYRFSGAMKLFTALVSIGTMFALVPFMRLALAMPGTSALMARLRDQSAAQHRSKQQLDLTMEQLRLATQASGAGLWHWPAGGEQATWDTNTRQMFGLSADEPIGGFDFLLQFVHAADREAVGSALDTSLRDGGPIFVRFRITRRDGQIAHLVARGAPVRSDGTAAPGMTGVFFDTTKEETARELFRLAVEASPSAMLLADRTGSILMANRRAENLFGHAIKDLVGMNVDNLVPVSTQERHASLRDGFFAAPSNRPMGSGRDLFGRRQDGTEVPVEIGLNPIVSGNGTFVLASIIDITQRKLNEDLLRTSLLEKETLLCEVHHRVKNNMQVVSSMLQLQSHEIEEPRYRAIFQECQTRVRIMAQIHERLYASRNLAWLDGGDFVRELVQMLVRAAGTAQVALLVDVQDLRLDITTAIPLGLILNELVTNAFKHGFPANATGTLRISLVRTDSGAAEWARLTVADDGLGLPEGFDLMTARGLGLRMVRSLSRQIDARLEWLGTNGTKVSLEFKLPSESQREPTTTRTDSDRDNARPL